MNEREIFIAALEKGDPAERAAYLEGACGLDTPLRQRVEVLLREHDGLGSFLEASPVGVQAAVGLPEPAERPGTVIGPYKLLEQIGEGGMGLVFVAQQQQPVRRKVALKLIKPGMDSRQVIARFEAERQALALMDHPHIAKVFDAGTTSGEPGGVSPGRPYFVMELVRGVPITDYCDRHRLDIRSRLALFVQVCQAVQHAHMKGIIHRDLKPGNVLVAHDDTVPVPKVIDFGVAKATTQPLTERTLYTGLSQVVGTPLYMSPEQSALHHHDVDTRSDVYALGVLLYELLTGTTPFEAETLRRVGLDEVRRLIREQEPPAPSQRVSTLEAAKLTTLSEQRGVDVRRLRQVLRGELDWVVMKCLEKDRDRRYESASALAADVQRYLDDEPVAACPPSAAYRLRKYVRRNRRLLVTAGLFVAVLVAATAVSTWQAVRAWDAERRAATEAAIARAVNDFLQEDLLGQADSVALPGPGQEIGGDPSLTVKEALGRAAARIGQRFQDQPLVEAAIRTTIGAAYRSLSENRLAVPQLERAVALRQDHLGPDHPDTLDSMRHLAYSYQWGGRHPDAIALHHKILDNRKAKLGPDHPETLVCLAILADSYWLPGRWDTSLPLLEQVLEKQRTIQGPTHPSTLSTIHFLAMNYGDVDRLAESVTLYEKLLELHNSTGGPEHDELIWWMLSFAQVCQRAGKLDQADRLLREALEHIRKRDDSRGRRVQTANARGWLALNLMLQEQFAVAEPLAREAVAIFEKLRPNNYRGFYWVSLLGAVLSGQEKYAEAEPLLLQGYQGMKRHESIMPAAERRRLAEAGERIIRFYEVTRQPEKAHAWRTKLSAPADPGS